MFDGDWYFALASYNAGPGRLQRAVRRSKTTDYWKITARTRYLPRETREYVPMILAAIIIAKNPDALRLRGRRRRAARLRDRDGARTRSL